MAPRKRARLSTAATSSPPPSTASRRGRSTSAMPSPSPSASEAAQQSLINDPWTDAEETALFKQLIRYKPTGLHKHMSMLSIYTNLLAQGYVRDDPLPTPFDDADLDQDVKASFTSDDRHMSIPGIWRKLNELYDLEALNEREEEVDFARAYGEDGDEAESSAEEEEPEAPPPRRGRPKKKTASPEEEESSVSPAPIGREFELPSSDESDASSISTSSRTHASFAALKWAKRFASPSPSVDPGSPSTGHTKRGRPSARSRIKESDKDYERERRDSSPPELPDLLPSRTDVPVRFTPSFDVPADVDTPRGARGRGRGRPQGRGRGAAGGRRSSHAVAESGSEDKDEEESDEGSGEEEGSDEEESNESGEEADEESPQKKKRGRPSRGRGRGTVRGRGRKK